MKTEAPARSTHWRHLKTGRLYHVVRVANMEADLTPVVVYEDLSGHVWVRPLEEFMDGRFEQVPSPFQSRNYA